MTTENGSQNIVLDAYRKSAEEEYKTLSVDPEKGLSDEEVVIGLFRPGISRNTFHSFPGITLVGTNYYKQYHALVIIQSIKFFKKHYSF